MTDEAQGHGGTLDIDPIDAAMMARCIELSRIGAAVGELPIGSLIARRGQIIAESTNEIMRLTDRGTPRSSPSPALATSSVMTR